MNNLRKQIFNEFKQLEEVCSNLIYKNVRFPSSKFAEVVTPNIISDKQLTTNLRKSFDEDNSVFS